MSMSFPPFTRAVKELLIANGVVFLLVAVVRLLSPLGYNWVLLHFSLIPALTVQKGWLWQLATYSFLHAGLWHLLGNMLGLWMFGAQIERDWGYSIFLQFYVFCLVGAALTTVAVSYTGLMGVSPLVPTVGASGAVYGILLAFGILHGDSEVLLFPLPFLMKARYLVIGVVFMELWASLAGATVPGQSVAYFAHLGGLLFGYLWVKLVPPRGFGYAASERAFGLRNSYYRWKRKRAARNFEVYMRKHDRSDYRHDDYFDEHGNLRDPSTRDVRKKNGDSTPPWVN
jgi:membrane associated rhomboid family serine protease